MPPSGAVLLDESRSGSEIMTTYPLQVPQSFVCPELQDEVTISGEQHIEL